MSAAGNKRPRDSDTQPSAADVAIAAVNDGNAQPAPGPSAPNTRKKAKIANNPEVSTLHVYRKAVLAVVVDADDQRPPLNEIYRTGGTSSIVFDCCCPHVCGRTFYGDGQGSKTCSEEVRARCEEQDHRRRGERGRGS